MTWSKDEVENRIIELEEKTRNFHWLRHDFDLLLNHFDLEIIEHLYPSYIIPDGGLKPRRRIQRREDYDDPTEGD